MLFLPILLYCICFDLLAEEIKSPDLNLWETGRLVQWVGPVCCFGWHFSENRWWLTAADALKTTNSYTSESIVEKEKKITSSHKRFDNLSPYEHVLKVKASNFILFWRACFSCAVVISLSLISWGRVQKHSFPYRESNPGRLGENQES